MFIIDPKRRPSAIDLLKHPFLREDHIIDDETVPALYKKCQVGNSMR
jgi:hypothetical protein